MKDRMAEANEKNLRARGVVVTFATDGYTSSAPPYLVITQTPGPAPGPGTGCAQGYGRRPNLRASHP